MIIRLRSRDGLERVEVSDDSTVEDLRDSIHSQLGVPLDEMHLSQDAKLLTSRDPSTFIDLSNLSADLKSLKLAHGSMVYLWYLGTRDVPSATPKRNALATRPFGAKLTLNDVMARQTKIERQVKPTVEAVSFDSEAAGQFQLYLQSVTKFRVKRGGILYGTYDEENSTVNVEFIYEPPQSASPTRLNLEPNPKEGQEVDFLAQLLGLRKVGLIFSYASGQSQEWIADTHELLLMAKVQSEVGPFGVTATVAWVEEPPSEEGGKPNCYVHFEAFQCSKQCVDLFNKGWLRPRRRGESAKDEEGSGRISGGSDESKGNGSSSQVGSSSNSSKINDSNNNTNSSNGNGNNSASSNSSNSKDDQMDSDGITRLVNPEDPKNPTPAMLNSKDVGEVDNDFFLCPIAIRNHKGLLISSFPVENRLTSQSKSDLRDHLRRQGKKPYVERISDLHLLLWLSKQATLDANDMALLCDAVRYGRTVLEGYRAIIDSIAGL
mmetsp:Transcript_30694/g.55886  ORF Transcript_30694/g.55886 Transcript_30694/m.55886 type:complete len:491 (-) Transcript_30694:686-2158(-)|eukprot:CAMPEP_0175051114 /NCGR_PEP_ID=MMETSP0052_2-20121109/7618_1 /TAXON_ID=51329 ORGANISM="Polytomella parva, Strain SAG 63-3" /NCGR_SAMPLE_ID=MMETSP0052_2 /ASSEMBLY_ACC=CAM_ASM_000194 /LENGTH=490 /DNA_ID=CAMNT_0016315359 /DNA_START=88 /DNA_END=1560 /DNA_ORIENTATION=+